MTGGGPLERAAQALFTRFNDPRMWEKLDDEDRTSWLNIAASVVAAHDAKAHPLHVVLRERIRQAVDACERFETNGKLGAVSGYQHSTHVRDILTDFGRDR